MHTISISKFILLIYNNKEKILKTPKKRVVEAIMELSESLCDVFVKQYLLARSCKEM